MLATLLLPPSSIEPLWSASRCTPPMSILLPLSYTRELTTAPVEFVNLGRYPAVPVPVTVPAVSQLVPSARQTFTPFWEIVPVALSVPDTFTYPLKRELPSTWKMYCGPTVTVAVCEAAAPPPLELHETTYVYVPTLANEPGLMVPEPVPEVVVRERLRLLLGLELAIVHPVAFVADQVIGSAFPVAMVAEAGEAVTDASVMITGDPTGVPLPPIGVEPDGPPLPPISTYAYALSGENMLFNDPPRKAKTLPRREEGWTAAKYLSSSWLVPAPPVLTVPVPVVEGVAGAPPRHPVPHGLVPIWTCPRSSAVPKLATPSVLVTPLTSRVDPAVGVASPMPRDPSLPWEAEPTLIGASTLLDGGVAGGAVHVPAAETLCAERKSTVPSAPTMTKL